MMLKRGSQWPKNNMVCLRQFDGVLNQEQNKWRLPELKCGSPNQNKYGAPKRHNEAAQNWNAHSCGFLGRPHRSIGGPKQCRDSVRLEL